MQSQSTHKIPPLFCLCYDFYFMALRHGHSINTCELRSKHFICDVSTESSQSSGTTSSQMLQWPPHLAWTVSSTQFLVADQDYSATSPDSVVMFQRPASSPSAVLLKMDILLTLLGGAQNSGRPRTTQLDHISYATSMSLTNTFSLAQGHLQWRAVATAAKATCT